MNASEILKLLSLIGAAEPVILGYIKSCWKILTG